MRALDRILQRMRIDQVAAYIQPNARVLDIGCADGALYDRVGDVAEYVGIDPEAPTERTTENARFIRTPFPSSVLQPSQHFDVVTALAILEHVPRDTQGEFAAACAAHLRPGGVVAITVPSPAVDWILAVLKRLKLVDGMHEEQHYGYRPAQASVLFSSHGLALERHRTFELGLNHLFVFRKPEDGPELADRK